MTLFVPGSHPRYTLPLFNNTTEFLHPSLTGAPLKSIPVILKRAGLLIFHSYSCERIAKTLLKCYQA